MNWTRNSCPEKISMLFLQIPEKYWGKEKFILMISLAFIICFHWILFISYAFWMFLYSRFVNSSNVGLSSSFISLAKTTTTNNNTFRRHASIRLPEVSERWQIYFLVIQRTLNVNHSWSWMSFRLSTALLIVYLLFLPSSIFPSFKIHPQIPWLFIMKINLAVSIIALFTVNSCFVSLNFYS